MHFWIDKRSQTCGFSGRHRVPSSLSAGGSRVRSRSRSSSGLWGGGSGGVRPTGGQAKPMVTPVHRFQSIDSVASATAAATSGSRLPRHHPYRHHPPGANTSYRNSQIVVNGTVLGGPSNAHHNQRGPNAGQTHVLDLALLDVATGTTSHLQGTPIGGYVNVPPPKIRCSSVWISFTLLTMCIAGVKFYFNSQDSGVEVMVFAMVLVVALIASCYVSICRNGTSWEMLEAMVSPPHLQDNLRGPAIITAANATPAQPHTYTTDTISEQASQEDLVLSTVLGTMSNERSLNSVRPPPPYHLAILLPQQPAVSDSTDAPPVIDESPPPSYDKAVS